MSLSACELMATRCAPSEHVKGHSGPSVSPTLPAASSTRSTKPSAQHSSRSGPTHASAVPALRGDLRPEVLYLSVELDRVEPRRALVAIAQGARADEAGALAPERDVPLLQHMIDVEGDLLLVPVEAQLDEVPSILLVRRRTVRRAARP